MSAWEKGDRVTITTGEFAGQQGAIVDKDLIGSGITVALLDEGRQIKTEKAHLEHGGSDRVDVKDGQRVVVTQGRLKGEQGTVLSTDKVGDGIEVRLDDGKVIKTEEVHVAPVN